jgi:DNA-binding HxlR family transcriptional regulator/peroxiredoxin
MPRASWSPDADCGIAHALSVVGDWWTLLIVRDIARGFDRFDALATELKISRRVLTERLDHLVAAKVLDRVPSQPRHRYVLTAQGQALLPVLVAMQDWGDRFVLGDGDISATSSSGAPQAHRVQDLIGSRVPDPLLLPASLGALTAPADLISAAHTATVVFAYPATSRPSPMPDGWWDIAGTAGCTLENRLFRDRYDEFVAAGIAVHGLSSQRPDEQRVFGAEEDIPFPLYSDEDLGVSAALRLPVFRAADVVRLKRLILVIAPDRTVTAARFPVTDIADAVQWSLRKARATVKQR